MSTARIGDSGGVYPLDPDVLAELRTELEDDELVVELVDTFVEETPSRIEQLRLAASREDKTMVSSLAHAVKGSAGTFGAREVVRLCQQLEEAAGALEGSAGHRIEELVDRLTGEYAQAAEALQRCTDRLRP